MVSLFFLFGVSAKHFNEEVSTTVSQKLTTGSATWRERQRLEHNRCRKPESAEGHEKLYLDFYARIHLPQVMHDAVQIYFSSAKYDMLS